MRIAIDASSVPPRPAGAGVYAIELVRAMAGRDRQDGYALYASGHWLDDELARRKNWRIEHVTASSRPARLVWEQFTLPRSLSKLGIDVLHSTHHTLPLRSGAVRKVVTIHDVTFFRIPDRYPAARRLYMQTMTRLAARVADAIIVPSNAVRADVIRTLGARPERVTTVYEAAASRFAPAEDVGAGPALAKYGIDFPYVLSVGSLEPGKNRGRLIGALRTLRDAGFAHHLIVVGQQAWKYDDEFAIVERLGMTDCVHYVGYVPDDDLPALYSGAIALAFPCLYEGFGLPVIEAMACGVPVLTSNISATAEVAGDAALLVDPLSGDEIREGLRRLFDDSALRRDLAARGRERAAQFSWRRAADETHAVYKSVIQAEKAAP